jgi:hypothetical protein
MSKRMVVTGLLALSCVLNTSCGTSSSGSNGSNTSISQTDVTNFTSLLASSAASALSSSASAQNLTAGNLKTMSARILKAMPARSLKKLNINPESLQVQCNSSGTSCTFSDNFNVPYTCQTGGTMSIAGTLTGNGTQNSANLSIDIIVSVIGWTCDGPSITTIPGGITITGTFDYPGNIDTMTIGGGFTAGSQTCDLNVTVNGNSDGSGDISGTACGDSVQGTF